MTIDEITDEQICRKIAESLGWKLISKGSNYDEQLPIWKSPEGNLFAKVPNFFTGPAARDLLVRKMLEKGWKVVMMSKLSSNEFCLDLRRMGKQVYASGTYDRIFVLAYLKTLPDAKENER